MIRMAAAVLALSAGCCAGADDPYSEAALLRSPALGPHIRLTPAQVRGAKGFTSQQPFVGTYYFIWYDGDNGEHFTNPDGSDALVDHPVVRAGFSYKRAEWHRKELLDLMAAGIDMILPVYWGAPPDKPSNFPWHYMGVPKLVEAADALVREGRRPPKIGMFYDTSSLGESGNIIHRYVDLSTADGRAWFYVTIRDYFSMVPPRLWATIGGRPVVFLYGPGYAKAGGDDTRLFPYVRERFAADFGGATPYIVAERAWQSRADNAYDWGAAFSTKAFGVAAVGPGYDDHAAPGRTSPKIGRENGGLYRRRWEQILSMDPARRPKMAVVETWNELHEGTDICETREYGRQYIKLTAKYAAEWRAGKRRISASPFSRATEASATFGTSGKSRGVRFVSNADGLFQQVTVGGVACTETTPNPANGEQFLYADVDDGFYFEPSGPVTVAVTYLDEGGGAISLTYDSTNVRAQMAGAYTPASSHPRGNTGLWKTVEWRLTDARFCNRENSFTDMRISAGGTRLRVRRIAVRRG